MEEGGYVADTNLVLDDVEEEAKEDMLHSHSEKLCAYKCSDARNPQFRS